MRTVQRILLVEDDKDDQEFFINAMNEIDNTSSYDIANNGKEAIDLLKEARLLPTLIFLDINMPLMNGMEFLELMRKDPNMMNIPVVVLSTSAEEKKRAKDLGANAYIRKSSDYKVLRGKLKQMLDLDFIKDSFIARQTFTTEFSGNAGLYGN